MFESSGAKLALVFANPNLQQIYIYLYIHLLRNTRETQEKLVFLCARKFTKMSVYKKI